jgi:hypothetical protein
MELVMAFGESIIFPGPPLHELQRFPVRFLLPSTCPPLFLHPGEFDFKHFYLRIRCLSLNNSVEKSPFFISHSKETRDRFA